MTDDKADEVIEAHEIHGQLNVAKKEIRICHVEDKLDEEGRVRCRLQVVSLPQQVSLESVERADPPMRELRTGIPELDNADKSAEHFAAAADESPLSEDAPTDEAPDCNVDNSAQSNTPKYKAISWTWGDPHRKAQILLNDQLTEIPANAEILLRRLCCEQRHLTVWLDAICINQADIVERGQQVAIMRDIYLCATQVLVWLGEDDQGIAEAAFASVDKLVAQCMDFTLGDERALYYEMRKFGIPRYLPEALPDCDWRALEVLYANPCFTRLWVVQEIILGNAPCCYCGVHSRDWAYIRLAARWLDHRVYHRYMARTIRDITISARMWDMSFYSPGLAELLPLSLHLNASEPLDKVYGILGIVQDEMASQEPQIDMVPDYRSNLETVYALITKAALLLDDGSSHALWFLDAAQALVPSAEDLNGPGQDWPSWVPRYHWRESADEGSPPSIRGPADAGGGTRWSPEMLKPDARTKILTVQGILVDRVKICTEPFTRTVQKDDISCYRWISSSAQIAPNPPNLRQKAAIIALTLTCEMTGDSTPVADTDAHAAFYEEYIPQGEGTAFDTLSRESQEFVNAVWAGSANRVFFTTPLGEIGMGPPGMQTNDLLCIFFGGASVFVLRQQEEHYVFVGTAYMYGFMSGQYIGYLKTHGRFEDETRWFEIH